MKKIEAIFTILAMVGSVLIANKINSGWVLFLISSIIGVFWGIKTKNFWISTMQAFFTVTNIMGIVNYYN